MLKNKGLLVRRIRGKLRAAGIRGYGIHPEDIFASVQRRIDLAFVEHRLRTDHEREFWGYIYRTTDNLVCARVRERGREKAAMYRWVERRLGAGASEEAVEEILLRMAASLGSDAERQLFSWRMKGLSYAQIAAATGCKEAGLRTRFAKILRELRERCASPPPARPRGGVRRY